MSWFFLDTHERGRATYGWIFADHLDLRVHRGRLHTLLSAISRFAASSDFFSCSGVCVVSGPGPFSSIRSGVLLANLLARIYRIPLFSVSVSDAISPENLIARLSSGSLKSVSYIAPIYDRDPNITIREEGNPLRLRLRRAAGGKREKV